MCGSGSKFGIRIRIHKVVEYGSLSRGSGTALPLQEEEAEAAVATGGRRQESYQQKLR